MSLTEDTQRKGHVGTDRRWQFTSQDDSSPGTTFASTLMNDFWPPELWENEFLLLKTSSLWSFIMTARADWYTTNIKQMNSDYFSLDGNITIPFALWEKNYLPQPLCVLGEEVGEFAPGSGNLLGSSQSLGPHPPSEIQWYRISQWIHVPFWTESVSRLLRLFKSNRKELCRLHLSPYVRFDRKTYSLVREDSLWKTFKTQPSHIFIF